MVDKTTQKIVVWATRTFLKTWMDSIGLEGLAVLAPLVTPFILDENIVFDTSMRK